ncbi:MAG: KaiC 1, partial [Acidobacteria bacterium]|nr:KaiC 1 [Acidobacteriota bacterium]
YVLKSRGMGHSNQVREFVLSRRGIDLVDVYLGTDRVLTGAARVAQEAQERAAAGLRRQDHELRLRQLAAKRKALVAQIAALQAEGEAEEAEVKFAVAQETLQADAEARNLRAMAKLRGSRRGSGKPKGKRKMR